MLLAEIIVGSHDLTAMRCLLSAAAALKGHPKLGEILECLDVLVECPECGAKILEYAE